MRSRGRMLVLISTDSVQRPSWALDSAPWSGEPNPIGLWAPVAPALHRGGGGAEARKGKRIVPTPTYRPTEVVPEATGSPLPPSNLHCRHCSSTAPPPALVLHVVLDLNHSGGASTTTVSLWTPSSCSSSTMDGFFFKNQ